MVGAKTVPTVTLAPMRDRTWRACLCWHSHAFSQIQVAEIGTVFEGKQGGSEEVLHLALRLISAIGGPAMRGLVIGSSIFVLPARRRWWEAMAVGVTVGGAGLANTLVKATVQPTAVAPRQRHRRTCPAQAALPEHVGGRGGREWPRGSGCYPATLVHPCLPCTSTRVIGWISQSVARSESSRW